MKGTYILIALVGAGILGGLAWYQLQYTVQQEEVAQQIMSFEDCEAAGLPVMESYPRQCATPDGRTFAEELPAPAISYTNASEDMIVVAIPSPGSVTGKEFTVVGEARGNWYFEASFPIELQDEAGNVLATGIAQAQSDWMTTDFVPFMADIIAPSEFIGPAVLVLKKDNASGLPEHDASISFPITVEY